MIIPANPAAEQIQRLNEINTDIDAQIQQLQETQQKNRDIIEAFNPTAEWAELPDPEPETAPEVPPALDMPDIPVDPYADVVETPAPVPKASVKKKK